MKIQNARVFYVHLMMMTTMTAAFWRLFYYAKVWKKWIGFSCWYQINPFAVAQIRVRLDSNKSGSFWRSGRNQMRTTSWEKRANRANVNRGSFAFMNRNPFFSFVSKIDFILCHVSHFKFVFWFLCPPIAHTFQLEKVLGVVFNINDCSQFTKLTFEQHNSAILHWSKVLKITQRVWIIGKLSR